MRELPPAMTKADVKAFILDGEANLDRDERTALEPVVEQLVEDIFATRGNPRTMMAPMVIAVFGGAFQHLAGAMGIRARFQSRES